MPYLPAKDELVSLNRLSSRGLWKWYNSKVLDRWLYGVVQHFTFCLFSRKRKFFGNFDCDFRKCFTKGFFLTKYEEFPNFRFGGKFSIFTDSRSYVFCSFSLWQLRKHAIKTRQRARCRKRKEFTLTSWQIILLSYRWFLPFRAQTEYHNIT